MPSGAGIINTSMRENYNSFGVGNYYNLVQESCEPYRILSELTSTSQDRH